MSLLIKLRFRMKSGCSFGNAFHICVNTPTPQEGFSGLIERGTLGNGALANYSIPWPLTNLLIILDFAGDYAKSSESLVIFLARTLQLVIKALFNPSLGDLMERLQPAGRQTVL
jgi:hypothetical protein